MNHLKNIWQGFTVLATIGSDTDYPDLRDGFAKDVARLQGDKEQVIQQFNRNIQQEYGKQKYPIKG